MSAKARRKSVLSKIWYNGVLPAVHASFDAGRAAKRELRLIKERRDRARSWS